MRRSVPRGPIPGRAVGFAVALALVASVHPAYGAKDAPATEPEAVRVLKRMSDYPGSLEQFSVRLEDTSDVTMRSGQQLQLRAAITSR